MPDWSYRPELAVKSDFGTVFFLFRGCGEKTSAIGRRRRRKNKDSIAICYAVLNVQVYSDN